MRFAKILALPALAVAFILNTTAPSSASNTSIAGIAAGDPNFSILLKAVKVTGLAGVLSKPGNYTVFAPTNAAFKKLPAGTLESLLKPRNRGKLKSILLYHVLGKEVFAEDIPVRVHARTLQGGVVNVRRHGPRVRVNNARVTTANILASNGVVHVVNRVLLPKG